MEISLTHFFVHTIPESIIVIMFILFISGNEEQWQKGLAGGIFLGIFVLISRNFLFEERIYLHTLVYSVFIIILLNFLIDNLKLIVLIKATLLSVLLVFVSESIQHFVVFNPNVPVDISPTDRAGVSILATLLLIELLVFVSVGLGIRFYRKKLALGVDSNEESS